MDPSYDSKGLVINSVWRRRSSVNRIVVNDIRGGMIKINGEYIIDMRDGVIGVAVSVAATQGQDYL